MYCRRLETAIREQQLFPAISSRVNELEESDKHDPVLRERSLNEFKAQIKIDEAMRDKEVMKYRLDSVEAENKTLSDRLEKKESELERVFHKLNSQMTKESKEPKASLVPADPSRATFGAQLDILEAKHELQLEKKLSEILKLKSELQESKN